MILKLDGESSKELISEAEEISAHHNNKNVSKPRDNIKSKDNPNSDLLWVSINLWETRFEYEHDKKKKNKQSHCHASGKINGNKAEGQLKKSGSLNSDSE